MKAEYDFSKMKSRKNPYASKLKTPVTMRLSEDVIAYFKRMAVDAGVPYQSLSISISETVLRNIGRCKLPGPASPND
ncbi:MAG: BrnA antitoxin family protein [Dechloromonas sp.]|nr:BrnA antitoxin family protein [Dechloromonas sp.]